ncbi:MAG: DNA mismatch repair endonuclease MutL [Pirellulales bacterium]|nr:DNA mismatch repair endonuclease MutL [Pirellulales bacterium]
MPIRPLSQSLVNKIAAGEVVERPASVVKELMENAVDAGATRIDVSVAKGGVDLIRVADNGGGIPAEELPLALASHATSKIADADDLFRVGTLGFRGEALASIAAVSRMKLSSRSPDSQSGAEIESVGGQTGEPAPCGCPPGTIVEVRDLFHNTPVRRKFLRTTATEFGHVSEAFTRIALPAENIHFTLRHNDKTVLDLPAGVGRLERIASCFGRELADQLIWVESAADGVSLSGYAAHPSQSRGHNRMQYFFLHGRHIRDRSLQHALGEAYRGLLMVGRQPIAFLSIDMPPELVDVNVHPTKLEVRFLDSGRLYSQLLSMLRAKFLTTDLQVRVASDGGPDSAHDSDHANQLRQQLVDWAKGKMASWDNQGPGARMQGAEVGGQGFEGLWLRTLGDACSTAAPGCVDGTHSRADVPQTHRHAALQIHDRYLVTESAEGVTIIDQHALHERILYEQLRQRVSSGAVETQNLLVPEPVDLSPTEAAAALENRDLLGRLGVKVESFGGDTVLLSGYPAMLANIPPAEVLRAVLERILADVKRPDPSDLLDDLLHTIACKAAIKAGDRLAPEEISALLEQRHLVENAHHCPHGRPTTLVFTREELDRRFKRI